MSHALSYGQRCAATLITWLKPLTDRIEIAGSIRRERVMVGDVDLVVIPKRAEHRDLLGNLVGMENVCAVEIRQRCAKRGWKIEKGGEQYLMFAAPTESGRTAVQVDVWFATPENFGTVWLCRTGSKEHNMALAQRAHRLGASWQPHRGVRRAGQWHPATTEEQVYAALDLPFIPPTERDADTFTPTVRKLLI